MKVKVPKQIKIGALKANLRIKEFLKGDDGFKGYYNQRTNEMGIDSQLGEIRDRTFAHEITHMIDIDKECNLSEENISRISNGWIEFLRDNLGVELDWSEIETQDM